jgi:hypothetical protein
MDTASGAERDTSKIGEDEEEIGLAPLDEDNEKSRNPAAESPSGSDILGRRDDDVTDESAASTSSASMSDSTKSLLEEELDEVPLGPAASGISSTSQSGVSDRQLARGDYGTDDQTSTHTILTWLLVGAGTIILVLLLLGLLNA